MNICRRTGVRRRSCGFGGKAAVVRILPGGDALRGEVRSSRPMSPAGRRADLLQQASQLAFQHGEAHADTIGQSSDSAGGNSTGSGGWCR